MGIEIEGEKELKRSTIIKKDLLHYLADATFGSPKYQGFMDCMHQDELYDTREDLLNSLGNETDPFSKEVKLSTLRMNEQRMVKLEHTIEQKSMTLPGYFDAYYTVWGAFDNLGSVLHKEAEQLYPNNFKEIEIYVTREWSDIWDETREALQNRDQSQNHPFQENS
jgi:hypothetical protein